MTPRDLLDYLEDAGYSFRTDGVMLYVRGPAALDEDMKATIRRHKQGLIVELLARQVAAEQATEQAQEIVAGVRRRRCRVADKLWKATERAVASILGGERVPVTGRARGNVPDVAHRWLSVEVKTRRSLPAWLSEAVAQARAVATPHQLPIVVLHQEGARHAGDLVVMRLADWVEWFGGMRDEGRVTAEGVKAMELLEVVLVAGVLWGVVQLLVYVGGEATWLRPVVQARLAYPEEVAKGASRRIWP